MAPFGKAATALAPVGGAQTVLPARNARAAGGRSCGLAAGQCSGSGPSAASSAACIVHHGETWSWPAWTRSLKSAQSVHLMSETSAGSGTRASSENPAYTGQSSFSTTPFISARYRNRGSSRMTRDKVMPSSCRTRRCTAPDRASPGPGCPQQLFVHTPGNTGLVSARLVSRNCPDALNT